MHGKQYGLSLQDCTKRVGYAAKAAAERDVK
jgi:hypothetical protein